MSDILRALDHGESVTLLYRGKEKALLIPWNANGGRKRLGGHPAVGIWADRDDLKDVRAFVRRLRKGRARGL
jgi:antitoxin (DNA-binding transcriptional repressor) of toxin-antitoxin stability system